MAKFKNGVVIDFATLKPSTVRILVVLETVYWKNGIELWVTSGNDSKHMAGSRHFSDDAIDARTRNIVPPALKSEIAKEVQTRLGPDYDVVLESDHLHVEFDPK